MLMGRTPREFKAIAAAAVAVVILVVVFKSMFHDLSAPERRRAPPHAQNLSRSCEAI